MIDRYTKVILGVTALGLSACAPTLVSGNAAGGMVDHFSGISPGGRGAAFDIANAHCAKYGKIARVSSQDPLNTTMSFDCVSKDGP